MSADRALLLVSLCNPETVERPSLLAVDPVSWEIAPLPSSAGFGATGICRAGDVLFVAAQSTDAIVAVFDAETFTLRALRPMDGARDPHSLAVWDGGVAIASTGTDELLWYRYDGRAFVDRRILWSASAAQGGNVHAESATAPAAAHPESEGMAQPARRDTVHVNGVAVDRDRLLCCAFGPDFLAIDVWSEDQHGYVYDVTNDAFVLRDLARPHTVLVHRGELFLCESGRRNFRSAEREIARLDGYTRGITFLDDGRAVVATSRARVRSRSTGRLLDPETVGRYAGTCALHVLAADGTLERTISLAEHGREIYDVVRLR